MAQVTKNTFVGHSAHVLGNAKLFGGAIVKDKAIISGNVKLYDAVQATENSRLSGDVRAAGSARFSGNVKVTMGNYQGEADISSNDDYSVIVHGGKLITIYKSRCEEGFEVNVDGIDSNLVEISVTVSDKLAKYLNQLVKAQGWKK